MIDVCEMQKGCQKSALRLSAVGRQHDWFTSCNSKPSSKFIQARIASHMETMTAIFIFFQIRKGRSSNQSLIADSWQPIAPSTKNPTKNGRVLITRNIELSKSFSINCNF